jgi:chromosome segregation ATPase
LLGPRSYRAALDIAYAFRLEAAQAELLQSLDSVQEELTAVNRKKSELSEQVADLKRETSELNLKLDHSESEESALQCSFDKQTTCMHASVVALSLLRLKNPREVENCIRRVPSQPCKS